MYRIYRITNTATGKIYVGQTKRTLEKRFLAHAYEARVKKYNMYLHNSIRHHGIENFVIDLLEECDVGTVSDRERHWIQELNTLQPHGYNEHAGGLGGFKNPSPELREKLRRAHLGKVPWNKGLTKTDPRVALNAQGISKGNKGKPKSEAHKKAMVEAWKCRKGKCLFTEDTSQTSE